MGLLHGLRRIWTDHEEGMLYMLAAAVYVPAGVFLKSIVLNWIVGILFPVVVVAVIPSFVRRAARTKAATR